MQGEAVHGRAPLLGLGQGVRARDLIMGKWKYWCLKLDTSCGRDVLKLQSAAKTWPLNILVILVLSTWNRTSFKALNIS